jgi:hypothetical protein
VWQASSCEEGYRLFAALADGGVIESPMADMFGVSYVEATIPLGATTTRVDHGRLLRLFRYLAANPG